MTEVTRIPGSRRAGMAEWGRGMLKTPKGDSREDGQVWKSI